MTALPDGECGFHTNLFKKHYDNIVNFDVEIDTLSKPEKSGFLNSVILEYCPSATYDSTYLWKDLKMAQWHPRANIINYRNSDPFSLCHSGYEDVCCGYTNGELDSDGRIKITKFIRIGSSQEAEPGIISFLPEGMSPQRTACYVPVPFVEGTSRYFWVDLNKGIRAVYFPVTMKHSDETEDLSVWVKLDLVRYQRTYNAFSSKIGQKTGYTFDKWKNAKCDERGILETNKTIYVDVFEYIIRAMVPSKFRSDDAVPNDVVYWGNSNALQGESYGKAIHFNLKNKFSFIKRHTSSRAASEGYLRVDAALSNALKIDLQQQSRKIYPGWISPVVSVGTFFIGMIPFVGPVISLGIDVIHTIANKNIDDNWGDNSGFMKDLAIGSGKAAWDTLDRKQQQDIKKGLKETAMAILKCLKRSGSKSLGITTYLSDTDNSEVDEYRGLTIHDLWAEENAQLHLNTDLCDEEDAQLHSNTDLCDKENAQLHSNTDLCG
jgi:hypothetical protein